MCVNSVTNDVVFVTAFIIQFITKQPEISVAGLGWWHVGCSCNVGPIVC